MCGDAYETGQVSKTAEGRLVRVECALKKACSGEINYTGSRNAHVFNVVYAHLKDEQAYSVHRGDVSVIWSRLPLEGCGLYLYVNAFSFTGKQKGLNVLLLHEPTVVLPGQYDELIWENFDHVITHYDKVVEGREHFTKAPMPRGGTHIFSIDGDITEDKEERDTKYPIMGRIPGMCMINGNKGSSVAGELYSKRIEAALWFHEHSTLPFDVFGNPPFSLPNYRGALPMDAKLGVLRRYKYSLCFENVHHPVFSSGYVDKILSCLETRTIPIYLGAPDVDAYIPRECFIDFRSFRDYGELERYLARMSAEQYTGYVEAIDGFVMGGGLRPYVWDTLYDQLVQVYSASKGKTIEEMCEGEARWDWGLSPACREFTLSEIESAYLWTFEQLSRGPGAIANSPAAAKIEKSDEEKAISRSVDRLRKDEENMGHDLQGTMASLKNLIDSGAADANDHYHYAQCFITAKAYDQAIPILNRVLELFPNHTYALNDLGVIHFVRKELDAAFKFYIQSVKTEPHNHNALRNLLVLLQSTRKQKDEMKSVVRGLFSIEVISKETLAVLEEFGLGDAFADSPPTPIPQTTTAHQKRTEPERSVFERIRHSHLWSEGQPLRLHLGCGENHFEGYINIDYPPSEHTVQIKAGADIFADIMELDFPDCSVDEVRLHHVFEHFNRSTALGLLVRWHRWLKVGGRLHIETPDLVGNAKLLLSDLPWKVKMAVVRHLAGSHEALWANHIDHWFPERFVRTLE